MPVVCFQIHQPRKEGHQGACWAAALKEQAQACLLVLDGAVAHTQAEPQPLLHSLSQLLLREQLFQLRLPATAAAAAAAVAAAAVHVVVGLITVAMPLFAGSRALWGHCRAGTPGC
jgi:hypothetical protein